MAQMKLKIIRPRLPTIVRARFHHRRHLSYWIFGIAIALGLFGASVVLLRHEKDLREVATTISGGADFRGAIVSTCFTPAQTCVGDIISQINAARTEIRVQAYGFTSPLILSALATARARGVDVAVILTSRLVALERELPVRRMHCMQEFLYLSIFRPAIAHNKVMIIDRHIVITGSYNFTVAAERRNAENVTFIDSADVATHFLENWQSRLAASRPYTRQSP